MVFRSLAKHFSLRVHVTHPCRTFSFASAFRMRICTLSRVVVTSYDFGPNRLRYVRMRRIRHSTSRKRSALSWITPPRYWKWVVYLYLWPVASMTNGGARDVCSGVCSSIVSVFSDIVRPTASKIVKTTSRSAIILVL